MKYILYSAVSAENISQYLGKPEYSYYFVLKKYIPVFEKLGDVIVVHSFVAIEEALAELGDSGSVVICCAPPNKSYINTRVRVVNIFAWEFDNLPNENVGSRCKAELGGCLIPARRCDYPFKL